MDTLTANNLETGRRLYEAFARNDVDGLVALLRPDVVLDVPGAHPNAGRWTGIDGVLAFLGASRARATETIEVVDLLAGDRHVAGYVLVRGERSGRAPLDNRTLHLFEVDDDGRVASIRFHNEDQASVDAFWG